MDLGDLEKYYSMTIFARVYTDNCLVPLFDQNKLFGAMHFLHNQLDIEIYIKSIKKITIKH
jgi:hypothetical protein